ncbi:hypothetical protein PMAYCL1PPCAC_07766, partial [Pristionchus mayeri]
MVRLNVPSFQKDVIYIFQFAGNSRVSSTSPFCIKVEAFCRLHNLKFERRDTTSSRGSNGLLPFIELNGQQTADSEFILKRLTEHFHLNFPDDRTEGIGFALERMIENHTRHLLRLDMSRTVDVIARDFMVDNNFPSFVVPIGASIGGWMLMRQFRRAGTAAIGRFTAAEYGEMLRNDLLQLQNVLGDKQFLLGEEATRV